MKRVFLLFIFIIPHFVEVNCQEPVVYPDAVPERFGSNRYLTKDPYEKVKAYYVNIYGAPGNEGEQSATFFYEITIFEPSGIHINNVLRRSKGANRVFSELKLLIKRGEIEDKEILNESRYNEIEQKYDHLQNYYYRYEEDERGKFIPADEAIFREYNKKLGAGGTEAMNNEEIIAEAQKLIMSGKIEEGKALLEQMKDSMTGHIEYAGSSKAVDSWIE